MRKKALQSIPKVTKLKILHVLNISLVSIYILIITGICLHIVLKGEEKSISFVGMKTGYYNSERELTELINS